MTAVCGVAISCRRPIEEIEQSSCQPIDQAWFAARGGLFVHAQLVEGRQVLARDGLERRPSTPAATELWNCRGAGRGDSQPHDFEAVTSRNSMRSRIAGERLRRGRGVRGG